ncbi:MAG TPA: hypothetical protein VNZ03_02445 [Terriglobales bacterium]|nr:hypothetical protein [Terriglobales bacterium]
MTVAKLVMDDNVHSATLKLLAYCQANDWAGYEPYDVLNSKVYAALPFLNSKLPRLVLTQALKRSPINIRGLMLIPKTQNPKALGLFLSAFVKLSRIGVATEQNYVELMVDRLIALRSQSVPYWCWGYNFPWQTRTELVPRWAPNLVCTSFAASALLDAYEQQPDPRYLSMAVSAAEYILNELYWTNGNGVHGFGYPLPHLRSQVHNANFLGASLFCRVHRHTGEKKFLAPALSVARYSAAQQHADGGWDYGEGRKQRWIDNFHTGFNLSALRTIANYAETTEFDSCVHRGLEFYRAHFFREDGAVRYFHNQTYPIDTHCVAQSIITLIDLKDLDPSNMPLARSVFQWGMDHMWDDRGFFYYRILRTCKIRTSYMRWTQAWMFLALSMLLAENETSVKNASSRDETMQVEASV